MAPMTAPPVTAPPSKRAKGSTNPYPWYSPRFWHGMRPMSFWSFAASHGFRIHPFRWPMTFGIAVITPINTLGGLAQSAIYGRKIARTEITEPPVFIIGHWRSGTTFLHELMHLDERFGSPTTYQCFAPHHCLLSQWLMIHLGWFLIPRQRPMDNMAAGWDRPQEDEFALLTMGAPTPYLRMAFPNDPPPHSEFLDMRGCEPRDLARFERAMVHFAKLITVATGKRLLFKSPPHTGRIETLARLFPGAKFVHVVRNPLSLFASTVRLWQSLDEVQGFQMPKNVGLEEYVFDCLTRMYRGFEDQRQRLEQNAICTVRYEDLVAEPVSEVERIYREQDLGDYETVRGRIADYVGQQKDYKTNIHSLGPELEQTVRERWASYFERYGYE